MHYIAYEWFIMQVWMKNVQEYSWEMFIQTLSSVQDNFKL